MITLELQWKQNRNKTKHKILQRFIIIQAVSRRPLTAWDFCQVSARWICGEQVAHLWYIVFFTVQHSYETCLFIFRRVNIVARNAYYIMSFCLLYCLSVCLSVCMSVRKYKLSSHYSDFLEIWKYAEKFQIWLKSDTCVRHFKYLSIYVLLFPVTQIRHKIIFVQRSVCLYCWQWLVAQQFSHDP